MCFLPKIIFKRVLWTVRRFTNELAKEICESTDVSSKDSKCFIVSSLVILLTTGNV